MPGNKIGIEQFSKPVNFKQTKLTTYVKMESRKFSRVKQEKLIPVNHINQRRI